VIVNIVVVIIVVVVVVVVVVEAACLRVPARYIRELSVLDVCSSSRNCPPAICASAANVVYRDVDVFGAKAIFLDHILQFVFLIINY
jgi:hypothetical protein